MSAEGQTTSLFILRMWKLHMKIKGIHNHCTRGTSIMTPVAWLGLLRDSGWVLKILLHTWRHSVLLIFHRNVPLWGFCSVPLTVSVFPHYKSTVRGSKFTPGLTNSQTLGLSETSGGTWLQLLVRTHTTATIRTQVRCGDHSTWAACFTRHKSWEAFLKSN